MSKKWCQYCRVNIDYTREAIRKHQESRLHQQNQQRQIKHQRREAKKEHKNTTGYTLNFQKKETDQKKPEHVPKVSDAQEKKEMMMKMKAEAMDSIKASIHTFIAKKTEGKFGADIEYPEQPLLTTQRYNEVEKRRVNSENSQSDGESEGSEDEEDDFKMWRIELCGQTNKPCFINNITGAKLYEKPAGVILTEEETNRWEQLQKEAEEHQQEKEQVNVGQWQEVNQQQDIFVANAVKSESSKSDNENEDSEEIKEDIEQLRKQLLNSNTVSDKSRMMKKLILTGKQETVQMGLFSEQMKKDSQKYQDADTNLKKLKGFLPRKKMKGMTILTGEQFE